MQSLDVALAARPDELRDECESAPPRGVRPRASAAVGRDQARVDPDLENAAIAARPGVVTSPTFELLVVTLALRAGVADGLTPRLV